MKTLIGLLLIVAGACHGIADSQHHDARQAARITHLDSSFFTKDLFCPQSVRKFYSEQKNRLFWSTGSVLNPWADTLLRVLSAPYQYGIVNEKYHLEELQYLATDTTNSGRFARMDVLFTDVFLALHSHISRGRLDPKSYQRRDLSLEIDDDALSSLRSITSSSLTGSLSRAEPSFSRYHELKTVLKNMMGNRGDSLVDIRIQTLELNLERWRWHKEWPGRYVLVNIPSYMLRVVEGDSVWLETKVIVGKRETPTPVMENIIHSFIIYPYWHVPRSISTKEILPHLQQDPTYLHRNNFEVLEKTGKVILADTIQWKLYSRDHFPFTLRQREGSENSMGIIKFNFSNKYGVYLHDTNSKRLFEVSKRDLSHGCVRVKNAMALAHYLIKDDDIYVSPEDLDQYLSLRQRLAIRLRDPITLKLEYFTAEVRNDQPVFHEDIYKKDSIMLQALRPVYDEAMTLTAGF